VLHKCSTIHFIIRFFDGTAHEDKCRSDLLIRIFTVSILWSAFGNESRERTRGEEGKTKTQVGGSYRHWSVIIGFAVGSLTAPIGRLIQKHHLQLRPDVKAPATTGPAAWVAPIRMPNTAFISGRSRRATVYVIILA
jgi:hypothetical protein